MELGPALEREEASEKIQSICNGNPEPSAMQDFDKPREKPPTQEQREAMERTMGSNGKSNAKNNGTSRKSGRVLTSGCMRGETAAALHASPAGRQKQTRPKRWAPDARMSLCT
jgi:hypothetical protein